MGLERLKTISRLSAENLGGGVKITGCEQSNDPERHPQVGVIALLRGACANGYAESAKSPK